MNRVVSERDVERFRRAVGRRFGWHFDDGKSAFLAEVLDRRLAALAESPAIYLDRLESRTASDETGALAQELTVPETYFFRNADQYRAFVDVALPTCRIAQARTRHLRILSAGCASGEEAYTLAILVREAVEPDWDVSILGIDVNPAVVKKAARAAYSAWSLRETPASVRERWFTPSGREFALHPSLRAAVRFESRNLVADDPPFWQPDSYDIVFFRNVLMYFAHEHAQAVIGRISRALAPGGFLFLGHAETLRGLSGAFHLQHTHETFYYRKRDHAEPVARRMTTATSLAGAVPMAVPLTDGADTWIDAIRRASERIETLTGSAAARVAPPRPAVAGMRDLDAALVLLREERFSEALDTVRDLPIESRGDPDTLLLSASLLAHGGRLAEAEETCRRLLDVDELNAGAHYLLALCREDARDHPGTMYHDRIAIHLDPGFAMPHLHLGLLARRAGDREVARRELEQALLLLEREDSARLLLFGGGFGRETLATLCRTEIAGCGEAR